MKPTELRLGNLLRDKLTGAILKVTEIRENGFDTSVIDRGLFPLPNGWEAKPILLNYDWLIKLRFKPFRDEKWIIAQLKGVYIQKYSYDDIKKRPCKIRKFQIAVACDDYSSNGFTFQYVHELQNLYYALTKKELVIK